MVNKKLIQTSSSFILLLCFLLSSFQVTPVSATSQSVVEATVRLAVCGDGVKENPEECDTTDFGAATCRSQGFDAGDLSCTIACDLNLDACFGSAPTPTPSPSPTVSSPTPIVSTTSESTPIPTSSPNFGNSNQVSTFIFPIVIKPNILPFAIRHFDTDNSGFLEAEELENSTSRWVEEWQAYIESILNAEPSLARERLNTCDLNQDKHCNIVDFSILMYYSGRSE